MFSFLQRTQDPGRKVGLSDLKKYENLLLLFCMVFLKCLQVMIQAEWTFILMICVYASKEFWDPL